MSQELCRHPCLQKPACQHPVDSLCLVLQGWMRGERGHRFQLVVEGTLDLYGGACGLLGTWPTQASSMWGDGVPHPEPQHVYSTLS